MLQKCEENNTYRGYTEILMLKVVEMLQLKGTDHKAVLIASCSMYSFLI